MQEKQQNTPQIDHFYRPEHPALIMRGQPLVIGFGHRAQNGKDTVVNHLVQKYAKSKLIVRRYAFADALKVEVFDWAQATGFLEVHFPDTFQCIGEPAIGGFYWNRPYSVAEKLIWVEQSKARLRSVLQKWGTEFRRAQDLDYWVKKTKARIAEEQPHVALLSDMRFPNEAVICDVTVNVVRQGYSIGTGHASETELDAWPYDHALTAAEGDLPGLKQQAEELFSRLLRERI